jgi:hypothetical protein
VSVVRHFVTVSPALPLAPGGSAAEATDSSTTYAMKGGAKVLCVRPPRLEVRDVPND